MTIKTVMGVDTRAMRRKTLLMCLVFLLAAAFGYLEVFRVEMTNDTNYFMHCALRLWRFGASQFYDRCVDENAPFHVVLYSPLAGLAAYTHIDAGIVLHGACVILCVICLISLAHALKAHAIGIEERHTWLTVSAFALLVTPCVYGVFADREHLLFIFALPWIIQMLLCVRPLRYTCVLAAIGMCMKPHDVMLFGLLTLTGGPSEWRLRQRIFSASSLIIGGFMLLYMLMVACFLPAYFQVILPLSLLVYPAKYYSLSYKVGYAAKYLVIGFVAVMAFVKSGRMMFPWFGLFLACTLIVLTNAGWDYTFYALCVPLLLACATPWIPSYGEKSELDLRLAKTIRTVLGVMLAICLFSICTEMGILRGASFTNHNTIPLDLRLSLREAAGEKFILLSNGTWNTQVATFAGKPEAVFGYDNLWTYAWLFTHQKDPHYAQILHLLTHSFASALNENPTAVILEDISPWPQIYPEGIIGFLRHDPEVGAALKPYAPLKTIDYCNYNYRRLRECRYLVWQRTTEKKP